METVTQSIPETKPKPKLDDRYVKNIHGNDFVVYQGVLDLAHQIGLLKLEVKPIQLPSKENGFVAICKAVATTVNGNIYSDLGDADPTNVTEKIAPHILRVASTRAKGRALRDMCNIGMVCLEELSEFESVVQTKATKSRSNGNGRSNTTQMPKPNRQNPSQSPKMSEAQKRAVINLAHRRGIKDEELNQLVQNQFKTTLDQLSSSDAAVFIRQLQQTA